MNPVLVPPKFSKSVNSPDDILEGNRALPEPRCSDGNALGKDQSPSSSSVAGRQQAWRLRLEIRAGCLAEEPSGPIDGGRYLQGESPR